MEIKNLLPELTLDYGNQFGKEVVTVKGNFSVTSVEKGVGFVLFLSHQQDFAPTNMSIRIENAIPAEYTETEVEGNLTTVEITLPERFPATGFISETKDGMSGALRAPALRIQRVHGHPIIVLLFRSSPPQCQWLPEKHILSVTHQSGNVTASLVEHTGGGIDVQLSKSGEDYKNGAILMKRFIDLPGHIGISQRSASEGQVIGTASDASSSFSWKPETPPFDFISTFGSNIDWKSAREFLLPLGIDVGNLHDSNLQTQQFFCDGPGINYLITLVGRRSILFDEDDAKVWVVPAV